MTTGAISMLLVGITVLFGGLAVCIGIALKAGGGPVDGDD